MTIVYKFASAKTVQAQLTDCAASGCIVDFTVSGDGFTTTSFTSNKWMFTDATVFSGSKVSPDDGIWGAGPGEVNGNGDCYGDTNSPNTGFYGFGNCNAGDSSSSTVYYGPDGTHSCSSLKAWVYAGASPPPPVPLTNGVNGADGCGAGKCDRCEGDCDSDSDCKAGLTCFQRDTGSVPGCSGVATTDWDYCIPE